MAPGMKGVDFSVRNYWEVEGVGPGDIIYCDPPYRNTGGYRAAGKFDHDKFWEIAEGWARAGAKVFVSEYEAPDGWTAIWERETQVSVSNRTKQKKSLEKLFIFTG